jgi:uncharacterized protein YjbJ (UPF0337 family)
MTDDRVEGRGPNRKVEEDLGRAVGNTGSELHGRLNQAAGVAQEAYGRTRDVAFEGAQSVKDAIVTGHDAIANFMEENPHTTTLIALGIGLLIGYTARRPTQRRSWWD